METRTNEYLINGHGIAMTGLNQSVFIAQGQGTFLSFKKKIKNGVFILPRKKWETGSGVDVDCACH